jgi:hypothetical protein
MQTLFILKLEQSSQLLRILLITTTLALLALGHSILATISISMTNVLYPIRRERDVASLNPHMHLMSWSFEAWE